MATTKPIRSVSKTITPMGSNLILLDDGISMGKAALDDSVAAVADGLISNAIDDLSLGTASQSDATDFATSSQGTKADSAVQPGDLSSVATSGDYDDLSGKPTLGTAAAADTTDFATASQGSLADTSLQPSDAPSDPDLSNDTDKLALRGLVLGKGANLSDLVDKDAAVEALNVKALNDDGGFTFAHSGSPTTEIGGRFGASGWDTFHRLYANDTVGGRLTGAASILAVFKQGVGSGGNGQANGDSAAHLEYMQTDYLTTTVLGEFEALNIVGSGGSEGDKGGILLNLRKVADTVYGLTTVEAQTDWVDSSGTVLRRIKTTQGAHLATSDLRNGGLGYMVQSQVGGMESAFLALTNGGTGISALLTGSSTLALADRYLLITGDAHVDGSGLIRSNSGSAALPSHSFVGDANTGMYSVGSDVLGLATAGVERARLQAGKLDLAVPIEFAPGNSYSPTNNGDLAFEFTTNTSVKLKGKGSDGTIRAITFTLA